MLHVLPSLLVLLENRLPLVNGSLVRLALLLVSLLGDGHVQGAACVLEFALELVDAHITPA